MMNTFGLDTGKYDIVKSINMKLGEASASFMGHDVDKVYFAESGTLTITEVSPEVKGTFNFTGRNLLVPG